MPNINDFGEAFAKKTLERFYVTSIFKSVTNSDYEGVLGNGNDRVNLHSILQDVELGDYAVGSDMDQGQVVDAEDVLIVEKRKYYNFGLDRLEKQFVYTGNVPETLLGTAANALEKTVDSYILDKFASEAKAGSWIGTNLLVTAGLQTMASLTTTATGGTITIEGEFGAEDTIFGAVENPYDGALYSGGFENGNLYKGIRLVSTRAIVGPWWRISAVTNTVAVNVTEWDEEVSGPDFAENYTLRGVFGGNGITFPKYTDHAGNDVGSWVAKSGFSWEIQAAIATGLSATSLYDQVTLLDEALNLNETPDMDRFLVLHESGVTALKQASEVQPSGISEIYTAAVINGRVGRIGGFEVIKTLSSRLSSRTGQRTMPAIGGDHVVTAGATGFIIPASHKLACTFAEVWAENRVIDAENRFEKKYQGLFLYGAKVPKGYRKHVAVLFASA